MLFRFILLPVTVLFMLALTAGPTWAALDVEGMERLAALQRHPQAAGERIYRGQVHELGRIQEQQLFSYERRIVASAAGLTASHITTEPDGTVIVVERAQLDTRYGLQRFEAVNRQTGHRGSVVVSADGRRLDYQLVDNGVARSAMEAVTAPVVSGPSLHGFILQHWSPLVQGEVIRVRLIVLAEMRSFGFDIAMAGEAGGYTRFSVTPNSWWVRLAVAPLAVTFDDHTRQLVRYEGRVPPMVLREGRRQALDARVDYTMEVPVYQ